MSDDHFGVKVNGVLYVRLEDARKLREGWDKADERIAELEAALWRIVSTLDDPTGGQHVADMRTASVIAIAALKGGKDD